MAMLNNQMVYIFVSMAIHGGVPENGVYPPAATKKIHETPW